VACQQFGVVLRFNGDAVLNLKMYTVSHAM